jgi:hypothetical protein
VSSPRSIRVLIAVCARVVDNARERVFANGRVYLVAGVRVLVVIRSLVVRRPSYGSLFSLGSSPSPPTVAGAAVVGGVPVSRFSPEYASVLPI